ncbi:MAG: hypothetical protein K2J62_08850 [Bacteroidales bacterium]|nr:hypothetical protein [Bacteroidales bacterium]
MDLNLIAFYATGRTFSVEFLEETVERFSVKNGKLYYCFMPDPFEVGYARRVIAYDINSGISLAYHNCRYGAELFRPILKLDASWMDVKGVAPYFHRARREISMY